MVPRSMFRRFVDSFSPLPVSVVALLALTVAPPLAAQSAGEGAEIRPVGDVEKVHGGFAFTEGPAWDPRGHLYFTDIPNETIFRLGGGDALTKFSEASLHANGLMVTADGRLLACEMDGQVVAYNLNTGARTVLAAMYRGKRFNAPNDLVNDAAGGVYFTDPLFRAPEPLPQGIQAVYYVDAGGHVTRLTDDLPAPNGVGLSPDGKQLYVIPSRQAEMLVYDVARPGRIANGRTLCRLEQPDGQTASGGDGMAVDVKGNLYITSNLGIQIFSPAGQPRGIVAFPEQPANVTFGGPDRRMMYVTARTGLYRVKMPIAGLPPN